MYLEQIQQPNDIRKIAPEHYRELAAEIRRRIVTVVSQNGGHLAANLGAVELTMALHLYLRFPEDKLIFDVGHQCYTHKLLTGRAEAFSTLRQAGGLSGFPNRQESSCDPFTTGHSSNSISLGMGLVEARERLGGNYKVVSVIGDGAMTGGEAFEALNNASRLRSNFIIVLNDNTMSISPNIGGLSRALAGMRTAPGYNKLKSDVRGFLQRLPIGASLIDKISRTKSGIKQLVIPGMLFEDMGVTYLGPINGHDVHAIRTALEDAGRLNRAVLVHVVTTKGKGYLPAQQRPEAFHGVSGFNLRTGKIPAAKEPSYTDHVREELPRLARRDPRVVAISAAMRDGTGLGDFAAEFPERFYDVGIAEQHAVSFAGGLAAGGLKPYVCIYSTFLQRAYDQIAQDVCLQDLPVTFLVDRAGLVGEDGPTHQGMLDGGYLRTVPNLTILSPRDGEELRQMLRFSLDFPHPLAIRYPRGQADVLPEDYPYAPLEDGTAQLLRKGSRVAFFAAGNMVHTALDAAALLARDGLDPTVVNARFLKPLDRACLRDLAREHTLLIPLEENNRSGGLAWAVSDLAEQEQLPVRVLDLQPEDAFIPHGKPAALRAGLGLDAESVRQAVLRALREEGSL